MLDILLLGLNLEMFMLYVEAQAVVNTHVLVCNPDEGKPGDNVTAPAGIKHLKASKKKKNRCHIVAEAVLTREQIEEFSSRERARVARLTLAILPRLAENFFVGHRPCHTGDGDAKHE